MVRSFLGSFSFPEKSSTKRMGKTFFIWWFVVSAEKLQWSCSAATEFVQFLVCFCVLGVFPTVA